jgi:cytidylate kinase
MGSAAEWDGQRNHEGEVGVRADGRCVVAIDGPSGTGKSTVSRRLARALGACYLDTGAMYRAVTWAVLDRGVDPGDAGAVAEVVGKITIASGTDPAAPHIAVDGRPVDVEIRGPAVTRAVSAVAAIPAIRAALVAQQREIIRAAGRIVVEGRDIGSVVAPDADLKVYLTASASERARRRSVEVAGGAAVSDRDLAATQADLVRRDRLDSTRATDPLRRSEDAIEVDTTDLDVDQVVGELVSLVTDRTGPR